MPRDKQEATARIRFVRHPVTHKLQTAEVLDPDDDSPDFDYLDENSDKSLIGAVKRAAEGLS